MDCGLLKTIRLRRVCRDISKLITEPQFSNVLLVHQALGRGLVKFVAKQEDLRDKVVEELQVVLSTLLPNVAYDVILPYAKKIVKMAIDVKEEMSQEQALYHVDWVRCQEPFQEGRMDVLDENPSGTILFCLFPGLIRKMKDEHITVVPAIAKLRSAFVTKAK
jgi:hypothetical protein